MAAKTLDEVMEEILSDLPDTLLAVETALAALRNAETVEKAEDLDANLNTALEELTAAITGAAQARRTIAKAIRMSAPKAAL